MGKQRARRFCKWMAILTDERVERRDGSNGHIWVGGGWLVGAGLSRTGTGQPGASNGGSVHEFRPQCVAVAQHAVCKPGQVGKHGGCGTPESQWSQNGGGEFIAG